VFQEAAHTVVGKKLDLTEERLRELLDPVHFVNVTDCRGGVSPKEVARMIADRREKLAAARARQLERIEAIEKAQQRLLADLRQLHAGSQRAADPNQPKL
jgi:argininosuccinate lyase